MRRTREQGPAASPIMPNEDEVAPSARVRIHSIPKLNPPLTWEYPPTPASVEDALVSCALIHPGEEGYVAVCSLLRAIIVGEAGRRDRRRADESEVKARLLRRLDELPRHHRGIADARWTIANAEAECESVGESRLLWILRSCGIGGTQVQVPDSDGLRQCYIDIAIADLLIAIEFDGQAKYGVTWEERVLAMGNQLDREEFLKHRGWRILRVTWHDLDDPASIIRRLEELVASEHQRLKRVARPRIRAVP